MIGEKTKYFGNCRGVRHPPWGRNRGPRCSPVGFRICDKVPFWGFDLYLFCFGAGLWCRGVFFCVVVSAICEFRFCSCCGCGFCFLLLSFVVFCCFLLLFIVLFWTLPPLFCSSHPPILFTSPTYLPDCLPNYLPEYLPWLNLLSEFFVVVVVVFFAVLLIFFYMLFRCVAACY